MEIKESSINDIKIIELSGKFDEVSKQTEDKILQKIGEYNKIIFDCRNLTYIDSLGLRIFLAIFKKISKLNGQFVFCNLNRNVREVFHLTGFLTMFEIFGTQEEAIKNITTTVSHT
jgi:anti-sigma B factor antagonist